MHAWIAGRGLRWAAAPRHNRRRVVNRSHEPRRNTFYSTVTAGLEEMVGQALRDSLDAVHLQEARGGLLIFSAPETSRARLKKLHFLRNSFLLLRRLDATAAASFDDVLNGLAGDPEARRATRRHGAALRGTFRVMLLAGNRLAAASPRALQALEGMIEQATGLRPGRGRPDHELWVHLRTEGPALFSLRVTRHPALDRVLEPGELRPELADVLCRLSEPRSGELFLDPFAGWGAIPLTRAANFSGGGLVLANDADEGKVARLKVRIEELGLKKRVVARRMDGLHMSRYEDACIDKIVTDPPWGSYRELEVAAAEFYRRLLAELHRVLKPGGILVVLMARDSAFDEQVKGRGGFELQSELPILVSGKKATVYKLIKEGRALS